MEIYKNLAESQPSVYEPDFAMICNNLGDFYSKDAKRRKEAEACFFKALKIYKRLATSQPSVYEPRLIGIYFVFGLLYSQDADQSEQAEGYYKQAFAIAQKYCRTNFYCAQIYDMLKNYFS